MKTQTRIFNIVDSVEKLSGYPLRADDEGVEIGPKERELRKVLVTWMAERAALEKAEKLGADLVIAHESIFYPYNSRLKDGETQEWEQWPINKMRREIIERAGMSFMRVHVSADSICILDVFASKLGLGTPVKREGKYGNHKIYEIAPIKFRDLIERAKAGVGMQHVRVSCRESDLERLVRRIALPWGGLGTVSNIGYQEWVVENNCDAMIAGESDSYGFRFGADCRIPMIETSHEASEVPGFRVFMEKLAKAHPDIEFTYFECATSWRWF